MVPDTIGAGSVTVGMSCAALPLPDPDVAHADNVTIAATIRMLRATSITGSFLCGDGTTHGDTNERTDCIPHHAPPKLGVWLTRVSCFELEHEILFQLITPCPTSRR